MTTITASQVSELRKLTDAPMMDCKKALVETNGDIQAAIELMRSKGQTNANKKSGRTTAEGVVAIAVNADKKSAVIVELNSETDFVARETSFTEFAQQLAETALSQNCKTVEELNQKTINGQSIEEARVALIAKLGENINIRRIGILETTGLIAQYIHSSRIGVLVALTAGSEDLGRDIAMHIAASNPEVAKRDEISQERINKEKEFFIGQSKESGKPDNIIQKMVEGRLKKFVDEISLVGQPFVKDPNKTIEQLLKENNADIEGFLRFAVGEGIEKEVTDFASEVMAQARGN